MAAIGPENSREVVEAEAEGRRQGSLQLQEEEAEVEAQDTVLDHQTLAGRETLIGCMNVVVYGDDQVCCFDSCLCLSCDCLEYEWRFESEIVTGGVSERASSSVIEIGSGICFLNDFVDSRPLRDASSFRRTDGTNRSM